MALLHKIRQYLTILDNIRQQAEAEVVPSSSLVEVYVEAVVGLEVEVDVGVGVEVVRVGCSCFP